MGVVTTASERLTKAQEHIQEALRNLSDITINNCWGYDDYNAEYSDKIYKTYLLLLEANQKLK